ncbi:hypothetical protein QFZ70_000696 [Arthrobacter sp. V1I9]|nr:hypothetical protein [Arthrobacter sp. V1I9]
MTDPSFARGAPKHFRSTRTTHTLVMLHDPKELHS